MRVLLLEFNEICPPLLDRWMRQGKLPEFAAFHRASQVFTTIADETDPENLEPWIQWYSIHTGLPYREHKVFRLTDGPKAQHPDIWSHLHLLGRRVMNCSSMNARRLDGAGVFYLPDPWCAAEPTAPVELEAFKKVVSRAVQEYSRGAGVLSWRDLAAFASFLALHGLSSATVWAVMHQLASERLVRRDVAWKRVSLLDRLQADIFRHYFRRLRPDFASFFVNSTAHLQHAYWRYMDPGPFAMKPSPEALAAYGDAVLFGYQAMDRLLRDLCALADENTVVILCSALSQQPFLRREASGGQHFYRLRDVDGFLRSVGIVPERTEPVMTHQYVLRFADGDKAAAAARILRSISLEGTPVFAANPSGADALYIGCQLFQRVDLDATLEGGVLGAGPRRFYDALYSIDAVKSGRHHPEGVLWIRTGRHAVHDGQASILDILPTIYDLMAVSPNATLPGVSLTPRFAGAKRMASRAA